MKRTLAVLTVVLALVCLVNQLYGETIYFLVAETTPVHSDSYVLPLTEPSDIAHARDLIKYGSSVGQSIVVAQITCSYDCINRNYLDPNHVIVDPNGSHRTDKRAWSWHVTHFDDFADMTAEILDGWPGLVESDCEGFGSQIGFWTYTVVEELGVDPAHWKRDLDGDSNVGFVDYSYMGNNWYDNCGSPGWCGGTDFDRNGKVDCNDLRIFAESWLSPYALTPADSPIFYAWGLPYQCYGDADGKKETYGIFTYRIFMKDLNIFSACYTACTKQGGAGWPCQYPGNGYDPRCDFNRDYKIYDDDEAIITANYKKKDSAFPTTCPPKTHCSGN